MRIAVIVHGRFHAFDLVRELILAGQDAYVLTNYPKSVVARFGIPPERVRRNLVHGVVTRVLHVLEELIGRNIFESMTHKWFARWAVFILERENFDIVHGFSGVSEELFQVKVRKPVIHTLVRGSAHIEEQYEILCQEEVRTGCRAYKPTEWMRQRETREYILADIIIVLSHFALESFVARGVDRKKLRLLLLGTQRSLFRPEPAKIDHRCQRIKKRERLRVLTVGTFSLRKGAFDLVEIARQSLDFAIFRFVGTVLPRAAPLARSSDRLIEFVPKVKQFDLPRYYEWGDVFLFPTLEDGYAVVLAQAAAAGLPILATTNCVAADLIKEGKTGWVLPIRRPELFIQQLQWCDTHRGELAEMVQQTYNLYAPRDWSDVARDFVEICANAKKEKQQEAFNVTRA